jgi:hypothetical protein
VPRTGGSVAIVAQNGGGAGGVTLCGGGLVAALVAPVAVGCAGMPVSHEAAVGWGGRNEGGGVGGGGQQLEGRCGVGGGHALGGWGGLSLSTPFQTVSPSASASNLPRWLATAALLRLY